MDKNSFGTQGRGSVHTASWYVGPSYRGVDYSPTWPSWSAAPNSQTGDSDFANDAFQSFWSNQYMAPPAGTTSVPVNNTPNYRDDLGTISSHKFNLIRLYNWDMARGTTASSDVGLDHINFLDYANTSNVKVVVPVSDYFLGNDQYSWNNAALTDYKLTSAPSAIQKNFKQFIASITDPSTNKIHTAIHSISVGNEGDIGQGISSPPTSASQFLERTIWWIVNIRKAISGISTNNVMLSATFSNGDQGGNTGSWFNCLVNGVAANAKTPNGTALGANFGTAVKGLSMADSTYKSYYYNSVNISQVSSVSPFPNSLANTLGLYDAGSTSSWPFAKFDVPLLFMEVFTPNRGGGFTTQDQATAALGQISAMETYLKANKAGTSSSTTNFMGYCYFEFNNEQQLKLTGLFEYPTSSTPVNTGTTSTFYGGFGNMSIPLYTLQKVAGSTTGATLIDQIKALIP